MLKTLGAAALKDIIGMLKKEEQFFTFDAVRRQARMEALLPSYPHSFVDYLKEVSVDEFMKDLKQALDVFEGFYGSESKLLEALAIYIAHDLGKALDQLNSDFFFMDYAERLKRLNDLIPGASSLHRFSVELFANSTYQEVTQMAFEALAQIGNVSTIVIQTPVELEASKRIMIREHFLEKHSICFPEFQINPQIIGGMRILVNGEVEDHSWMGKIQALSVLSG